MMSNRSELKLFNALYADHYNGFVRFAFTYVRDMTVAEDIVTESFMAYWKNYQNLVPDSNIPAYLLTSVKNKCLNYLQHYELRNKTLSNIQEHMSWEIETRISTLKACNPEELFSSEIQTIVEETLASFSPQTTRIFTMSRYDNQSHKEIAKTLNITTKNVEYHITKVLTQLRKKLKDYLYLFLTFLFI